MVFLISSLPLDRSLDAHYFRKSRNVEKVSCTTISITSNAIFQFDGVAVLLSEGIDAIIEIVW